MFLGTADSSRRCRGSFRMGRRSTASFKEDRAEWSRDYANSPGGVTGVLSRFRTPTIVNMQEDLYLSAEHTQDVQSMVGAVEFVYHALPFGSAWDNASQGKYGEAAFDFAGNVAMFFGAEFVKAFQAAKMARAAKITRAR